LALAALGVLAFSFTMPGTVLALDGLNPYLIGVGRAAVAAVLAGAALIAVRAARPTGRQWLGLTAVGFGVVFGFPVLSTLALDTGGNASHGAVVAGLLPAATAVCAVLRTRERPARPFWVASAVGALCITGYALSRGHGRFSVADLLFVGAMLAAAVGYTEGGRLTREMPGWRVISWALVLTAPVSLPVTCVLMAESHPHWTAKAIVGFGYVSVVSMFVGFFAWYAGLGRVGIARASQMQLLQPLLTIAWAALFLGEHLNPATPVTAVAVVGCVAWTQRSRHATSPGAAEPSPARQADDDYSP
jgi:drug/metabolite transporter (DMT)-like permease